MATSLKMLFGYKWGKLTIAAIPQSQDKAEKSDWIEVDTAKLSEEVQDAFLSFRMAQDEANTLRKAFEAKMKDSLGVKTEPKVAKTRPTLAEYLAARR